MLAAPPSNPTPPSTPPAIAPLPFAVSRARAAPTWRLVARTPLGLRFGEGFVVRSGTALLGLRFGAGALGLAALGFRFGALDFGAGERFRVGIEIGLFYCTG